MVFRVIVMTLLLASTLPAQRATAIHRGIDFIVSIARNPTYFADYGDDLLWCLYVNHSKVVGHERALEWRRLHPALPPNASADELANLLFGSYAADLLGVPDNTLKKQLRIAAARFTPIDYLLFDPQHEPPPADIPEPCGKCHAHNERGAQVCHRCGAKLTMRSRYDIFCDALVTTYTGDQFGVTLGAPWTEVIKWLPAMRPYRGRAGNPEFQDMLYAVTHVVYTINDYNRRRVNPECLRPEFEFLKANLAASLEAHDTEMLGEFMDTLKAFGVPETDPLMQRSATFLLSTQNADGSWGDPKDTDIYTRYHATWTAIDGLRQYRFKPANSCTRRGLPVRVPELELHLVQTRLPQLSRPGDEPRDVYDPRPVQEAAERGGPPARRSSRK